MKSIFIALFSCVLAASAYAVPANTAYNVEVLIFENRLPALEGSELWTRNNTRTPIAEFADATPTTEISGTESFLSMAASALEKDGNYRVLVHRRWRQAAEEKSATRAMRLRNGDGQVDGAMRFYMSRYLHLDLDVVLQDKTAAAAGDLQYRLSEHRRIKTQEINYFDHPKFGVLVRVTSVAKE